MAKIFGTDGVRGIANTELPIELAMNVGRAAATVLMKDKEHAPVVLIGKDPRLSSDMLEAALTAGLCSIGATVRRLGVVPTPAVAYLVKHYEADAGIMISASHNSFQYNGIKIFDADGYKLSDELEAEIEALINAPKPEYALAEGEAIGRVEDVKNAALDYVRYIRDAVDDNFEGLRVAIDCANGAASTTAVDIFRGLGAQCYIINDQPDGLNINDNCGSTNLEALREHLRQNRCHIGIAFDGDADRCLAVDELGEVVDGDKLLAIFARALKQKEQLNYDTVVVTVMTNLGFFEFAEKNGINVAVTKVGDRYVLEEMQKNDYKLGGEQSGHIIFSDYMTTGDGQLSAAKLLEIIKLEGMRFSKLSSLMERFPQVMLGVKVKNEQKNIAETDADILDTIESCQQQLERTGRILVRPSGTEALIRIMVEGKDLDLISQIAITIAEKIKSKL